MQRWGGMVAAASGGQWPHATHRMLFKRIIHEGACNCPYRQATRNTCARRARCMHARRHVRPACSTSHVQRVCSKGRPANGRAGSSRRTSSALGGAGDRRSRRGPALISIHARHWSVQNCRPPARAAVQRIEGDGGAWRGRVGPGGGWPALDSEDVWLMMWARAAVLDPFRVHALSMCCIVAALFCYLLT